ncbi:Leptin receptor overlapping transcript-like 1 isoform 2 [Schistosoma japonicum]|uniref:Leptin receptor overlapping transcript-like 1 n=1 Tax=Schistosoma japonicum TaxID=6182 RepID=Q86FG0_SCHJA|nr:SJCHGC05777 protein [Schistosoma japonicum]KAH8868161.1 Leptin receptor overlapping transcript-like 1 [Schistosoma japonicum]TNN09062.1 Leptin receptor overlapping transcript-like 1 isoform 2 [Schistosoma japonicum]CAX70392.1 Leptin receptor overlapping transcript-like 1 [Schistosoma japonicum]CAX70393.1 Leptin receptor overlapping transcript-like 1 [Schistosoma japonicum]
MTGVKTVIFVSLAASISFTFLLLACALPQYNVWWPLFMLIFYIIAPVPLLLAKNCQNSSSSEDLSVFLTTVIVTSAYALPILFARAPKNNPLIFWGACGLTLSANTLMFATIFFLVYLVVKPDDFGIGF